MKNRKTRSAMRRMLFTLALVLVVAVASVGGTIAWLTATTETVTNTFTTSDISIELAETTGDSYKIVPGATVNKDPKATVESGSEKCYLYVKITNNLVLSNNTVATYNINTTDWNLVGESGNTKLYCYNGIVDASTAAVEKTVFTQVTYDGEKITKENIEQLKDKTIVLQAYAHQSDHTTKEVADAAANVWAGTTAVTPGT